jgi:hypothetical protein
MLFTVSSIDKHQPMHILLNCLSCKTPGVRERDTQLVPYTGFVKKYFRHMLYGTAPTPYSIHFCVLAERLHNCRPKHTILVTCTLGAARVYGALSFLRVKSWRSASHLLRVIRVIIRDRSITTLPTLIMPTLIRFLCDGVKALHRVRCPNSLNNSPNSRTVAQITGIDFNSRLFTDPILYQLMF